MLGVAATLTAMVAVTELWAVLALSLLYGAIFGVVFVILPGLAGETVPPARPLVALLSAARYSRGSFSFSITLPTAAVSVSRSWSVAAGSR